MTRPYSISSFITALLITVHALPVAGDAARQRRPEKLDQPGHEKLVFQLQGDYEQPLTPEAISRNGKWMVSGHGAQWQLWDLTNRLVWDRWEFPELTEVQGFTPDGTRLLLAPRNESTLEIGPVNVYAVPSHRLLKTIKAQGSALWCDTTKIRTVGVPGIQEYSLMTGRLLSRRLLAGSLKGGSGLPLSRFAFSANGLFVVEGSDSVIRWWRTDSGACLGEIKCVNKAIGRAAISDDGQWLATEGIDPDWRLPDEIIGNAVLTHQYKINLWSSRRRKLVRSVDGFLNSENGALWMKFVPGNLLYAGGSLGVIRTAPPPDIGATKVNGKADVEPVGWPAAMSSDGRLLVASNPETGSTEIWNPGERKRVYSLPAPLENPTYIRWSPDRKHFLGGGDRVTLWNGRTGELKLRSPDFPGQSLVWTSNDTLVSLTSLDITWISVPTLKAERVMKFQPGGHESYVWNSYEAGYSLSPSTHFAVSGDLESKVARGELWLWETQGQKLVKKIPTPGKQWGPSSIDRVRWCSNDRILCWFDRNSFCSCDLDLGRLDRQPIDGVADPSPTDSPVESWDIQDISADGNLVCASKGFDKPAVIYSRREARILNTIPKTGDASAVFTITANEVMVSGPKAVDFWDISTPTPKRTRILSHPEGFLSEISPDGKSFRFLRKDGSSFDWPSGKEGVRLYTVKAPLDAAFTDWIALAPDHSYNCSPGAEWRLRWRDEHGWWPIERSRARFKNPEKVARLLQGW